MVDDHDRDRRRVRTPPKGVRQQTAPETSETWDEDVTPLPSDPREALEKMDRRIKQSGTQTVDRVDAVRAELRADIRDVIRKMDGLVTSLMGVSTQTSEMVGQVKILVGDREADRQERSTLRVETVRSELEIKKTTKLADVEVARTRELAQIDEDKKRRDHRRTVALKILVGGLKILVGASAAWGALSTVLMARGC